MASTYSSDLKLELMATGENAGTWGTKTNTNLNLVQQAVSGYQEIDASSDVSLVMSNGSISNARNMVLEFTGTLSTDTTITIPDNIEKMYILKDSTTHNGNTLTFKTVSEVAGIDLQQNQSQIVFSDGTNINAIGSSIPSGTVMLFQQTAAPTGFTKITTHNNKALRVVNGSVTTGGTNSFTDALNASNNTSSTSVSISGSTASTSLSAAQMPSHTHYIANRDNNFPTQLSSNPNFTVTANSNGGAGNNDYIMFASNNNSSNLAGKTSAAGSGSGHTHGRGSLAGASHNHNLNLDIEYVDIILASKD